MIITITVLSSFFLWSSLFGMDPVIENFTSPDKRFVAYCDTACDHTIIEDRQNGYKQSIPQTSTQAIFSANNALVALCTLDFETEVRIYDLGTNACISKPNTRYVKNIQFCQNNSKLILTTNPNDQSCYVIWDLIANKELYKSAEKFSFAPSTTINNDQSLIAFLCTRKYKSKRHSIYLHNLATAERIKHFRSNKGIVIEQLYFSIHNHSLLAKGKKYNAKLSPNSLTSSQYISIDPIEFWDIKEQSTLQRVVSTARTIKKKLPNN